MIAAKPLLVGGIPIARGRVPVVCAPLVARTTGAILDEVDAVMRKSPDVLEWRVDHYVGIVDTDAVIDLARRIRQLARGVPLIFTCRSPREGGARALLDDARVMALYEAVCAARCAEFVDYELASGAANVARVRAAASAHGVSLIASYHDFSATPASSVLLEKFAQAARAGADVAKVAVTPGDPRDVLTLLDATWQASQSLDIALISMAMGPLGAVSRVAGFVYGSALTFGVGSQSSAPGQLAIDDLRTALDIVRRAFDQDAGPSR